jgi:hypothetical protein
MDSNFSLETGALVSVFCVMIFIILNVYYLVIVKLTGNTLYDSFHYYVGYLRMSYRVISYFLIPFEICFILLYICFIQ